MPVKDHHEDRLIRPERRSQAKGNWFPGGKFFYVTNAYHIIWISSAPLGRSSDSLVIVLQQKVKKRKKKTRTTGGDHHHEE